MLDPNKVNLSNINHSMINQSQEGDAIVQISHLAVDENALESYQIMQNIHSKNQSIKGNLQEEEDSQNNTIKLLKEDIMVGGQMGNGVKITKSSKGIRIG